MKKYHVMATMYGHTIVEANTMEEAELIANATLTKNDFDWDTAGWEAEVVEEEA